MADSSNTVYVGGFNPATESSPSSFTQAPQASSYVSPAQAVSNAAASPIPASSASSPITASTLAPASPQQYTTPNPVPVPDVSKLYQTPPLTETPSQKNESDMSTALEGLNNELVGKSAYQTQQNTAAGVDTLTQQQTDLGSQVKQLADEAAAIPNQLQLAATGRGITADGLAPLQTAALRNNSIQALTVSSLLDSTNGLLASAQSKADKAVAAKYDPIQEQINAATANLKLIQDDPNTTIEEKNQAQAQLDVQAEHQAQLDKDKQNSTDVLSAAQAAAKNGADPATLKAMTAAPDGATALQIAATAGYGNSNISDLMTKYPDAGIDAGDTLQQAQQKVLSSPSYTIAQKNAILQNESLQSTINKNNSDGQTNGNVTIQDNNGNNVTIPADIAPYYNTSNNGTAYVDASSLEGTAAQKASIIQQATAAGLKVITNKNSAADLVNIQDANSKLDSIGTIMAGIDNPSVLSTGLNNIGLTQFATLTQSDPQKAASGALQSVGLDILKAISGVQGFRGNASVVQQINSHLPTVYDTTETATTKIQYIKDLINSRENAILGTSDNNSGAVTVDGTTYHVGQTVTNSSGQKGIVNADGTITPQ